MSAHRALLARQCTGTGARAVVAAAAPIAAAVGAAAVRDGGNAYDAVVAAALAETVLLPPKCGLAGDLVALAGAGDDVEALVAVGGAARGLADLAAAGPLPVTGASSVGVPGAPAGYLALARRGRLGLDRLAAPAVALARDGFVWSDICAQLARESAELVARENPQGTRYFPDGAPLRAGQVVRLDGLARALEEFVANEDGFLRGPIGAAIVGAVARRGGVLDASDLASARAEWTEPVAACVSGRRLWATPAPTHGPSLLDAMSGFVDDEPAGALWDRVTAAIARRDAGSDHAGTSMVSAADADCNVVVVVHSNSFPRFGSGLVVDGYDLILSNRAGRGFSSEPGHANFPVPGKRPATTLHAWAVGGHAPEWFGATPGGVNQMPWNAQLLTQLLRGDAEAGDLVVAPRWAWEPDGWAVAEADLADGERVALGQRTHVEIVPPLALRCAQQVVCAPRAGAALVAAVDPRTGGAVVAV